MGFERVRFQRIALGLGYVNGEKPQENINFVTDTNHHGEKVI